VVAVDVGYGQLHPRLRDDPRVTVRERANARNLEPSWIPNGVDLVVVDASFISLRLLLPRFAKAAPDAQVLALVKPQFEVGKEKVGKGGVVRDDATRAEAVSAIRECGEGLAYRVAGEVDCELPGPKGNREIFLWLVPQ
jgi:23S rRNA (cytidine1920-2'-O)/16S rRNA (cytidine1409-2'-O)-methyltransferase